MPTNIINTEQQGYHSYNVKTLKNCLILNLSNKFNEIIKKKNIVN